MAGAVLSTPTFALQPAAEKVALSTNYITNFDFLNQYLPDTYEKEFERYGNRSIASFMRMVGAEIPSASDQIKWAEQGRLHIKYTTCTASAVAAGVGTFTISDTGATTAAIRIGQTLFVQVNSTGVTNKAIVTAVTGLVVTVAFYEVTVGIANTNVCTMFIYGSEFKKGTNGMVGSLEAEDSFFDNSPIIIKDRYAVNGSDMAQIGWVEVTSEGGASGFLWYLKSQSDTRLRFEDYLETAMIEAVPAEAASGAITAGFKGSEGVFYAVGNRGNVWGGGTPSTLADFDTIVARLDKQGSIEENALFVNRDMSFDIDDMLATLNGFNGTGSANSASFGLFDNDTNMALNLGFSGFRRGYDFYKSDWKYLNDPTMRGGLSAATTSGLNGTISGLLVPAGSTTVYDQVMGKNAKRPFLHVRYRKSDAEDRKYKTCITGSAGGATNSDLDAMEVNFLSERCVCTLGANNFVLFRYGAA
jgi:hypothetical protein